jgi:2-methylaconitate cis-trans-isomerase PrpF
MAVTGGIAIAAASRIEGTVAHDVSTVAAASPAGEGHTVRIAHPSGVVDVEIMVEGRDVLWAGTLRTARRIFEGSLMVPRKVWAGRTPAAQRLAAE